MCKVHLIIHCPSPLPIITIIINLFNFTSELSQPTGINSTLSKKEPPVLQMSLEGADEEVALRQRKGLRGEWNSDQSWRWEEGCWRSETRMKMVRSIRGVQEGEK